MLAEPHAEHALQRLVRIDQGLSEIRLLLGRLETICARIDCRLAGEPIPPALRYVGEIKEIERIERELAEEACKCVSP